MSQSEKILIQDHLNLPEAAVILYPSKHVEGLTSITFSS